MGIDVHECHIGEFDLDQTKQAIEICEGVRKKSALKVGRPPDPIAEAWAMRYHKQMTYSRTRLFTSGLCRQLSFCKTEEARRIILGVSR